MEGVDEWPSSQSPAQPDPNTVTRHCDCLHRRRTNLIALTLNIRQWGFRIGTSMIISDMAWIIKLGHSF